MNYYKEKTITGEIQSYRRVSSGFFYNSELPSITFNEDDLTILPDGQEIKKEGVRQVTTNLENPTEEFDLLMFGTDEIIGKATKQQVFLMLYSLWRHEAAKIDQYEQNQTVSDQPVDSVGPTV